jgi:DNA topoisomerase-2
MASSQTTLGQKYQKKSDKEHVLDNPDTYVGSIENVKSEQYVFDPELNKIVSINMDYNPALFKLFDEGIVNCRDHVMRMKQQKGNNVEQVNQIHVTIENDIIHMLNNGNGIDVEKHPEYNIWIPEMIFGHLRTSTNYNKNEKKITGGKNGFGFKLVLIWSEFGSVETIDHIRGLKYVQTFEKNLDIINPPKITKNKGKPYTQISFKPDYKRLGMSGITQQMMNLFQRRVYDIAGITSKEVKVKYNNQAIKTKDFQSYMDLYIQGSDTKKIYEEVNPRWSYGIILSDEFKQVSFVNGIHTSKGGKHVEYLVNQITKKMIAYISKKKKVDLKAAIIKEQITIFVNSTIENPSFDSQTKDYLNTPVSKFGSTCEVSDKIIDKLAKMGIMETACALSEIKDKKNAKKTDGNKSKSIRGIPKLVDANFAGTPHSNQCTLILCEGDSAKAGIVSGLTNDDRNIIGVYPMKGKIFNVRGENMKKINENKEIIEIKKILGLETGKKYTNTNSLRYGKVLFMTDQDLDGSHIKGLCLNLFSYLWPSLLELDDFIGYMNTPILKATKGSKILNFYHNGEYEIWKEKTQNGKGFKIKYYKGLGTSTSKEFKEYFKEKKVVYFKNQNSGAADDENNDGDVLDKVFNKGRANERKTWLGEYDRERYVDTNQKHISYKTFIDNEMIHFSKYDCDRSIPNLVDGLKVSQRKILYSAFKKKLNQEIKVAQFSGYVSEHSGYHHGEQSLNGAIINMAQDFVGSNNINLLRPNGQFGTRLQGGKDHASERYIFTQLSSNTRKIFQQEDDAILNYLDDDGLMVEPTYYVPIIPMILVNGAVGIGTGFSTKIPCYNPEELVDIIQQKIENPSFELNEDPVPYYRGFKGKIEKVGDKKYQTSGVFQLSNGNKKVIITELPVGTWNEDYITFLEKSVADKNHIIKDYSDKSTDKDIHIELVLNKDVNPLKVLTLFKLTSTITTTNMNLFNQDEKLTHYDSVNDIINDFIKVRYSTYTTRKEYLVKNLEVEINILKNKYNYIKEIIDDTIDLRKKRSTEINKMLEDKHYDKIDNSYNYLIKMPMDSVNMDNYTKLMKEVFAKEKYLSKVIKTTIQQMYISELNNLKETI